MMGPRVSMDLQSVLGRVIRRCSCLKMVLALCTWHDIRALRAARALRRTLAERGFRKSNLVALPGRSIFGEHLCPRLLARDMLVGWSDTRGSFYCRKRAMLLMCLLHGPVALAQALWMHVLELLLWQRTASGA
jgi:hypothetical protein